MSGLPRDSGVSRAAQLAAFAMILMLIMFGALGLFIGRMMS